MKKAGIWIDQHKAVVVYLENGEERVIKLLSQLPTRTTSYDRQFQHGDQNNIYPESTIEYNKHLYKFYRKVAYAVDDAENVFIFGPDTARYELKKEMNKTKDRYAKIRGVERAHKMTEEEIIKKVKSFFKH